MTTQRTINFGVIGCGLMGREFASAAARWNRLVGLNFRPRIVAAADPDSATLERFEACVPGVRASADHRAVLDDPEVEAVAKDLRGLARRATAVACDVMQREQLERLVQQTMDEYGRIDILVNNAGGFPPVPFLRTSERAFEEAFRFNVTTAFLLSRFVIPKMLEQDGGSIVNISSAAGRLPMSGFVAYGTAKAALIHLTKGLAVALAPKVRVNCVAPAFTDTPWMSGHYGEKYAQVIEQASAAYPLQRIATPDEVAGAILGLITGGDFVTGQTLIVDGGLSLS